MPGSRLTQTIPAFQIKRRTQLNWRMPLTMLWLLFSLALACWWVIFGLAQIDRISHLATQLGAAGGADPSATGAALDIARRHRMLISEGATLVLLLLGGGLALLYHVRAEMTRAQKLREFFAAFTHDIKTSLASLRLQAESLEEDAAGSPHERLLKRLVRDTVRLELQLENSLLLASPDDSSRFLLEPLSLRDLLEPMAHHWPELKVEIDGDARVLADRRAVESIFKNLLQNCVVHGRATEMHVKIERIPGGHVVTRLLDNGRGFTGDSKRLGLIFERHGSSSGSGLGLYLATNLARRLDGQLNFPEASRGFAVEVVLPDASVA